MAFETRSSELLLQEQAQTLSVARPRFGLAARALFALMDLAYGKRPTFLKFRVLEVVARVPYQAWENIAYVAITHCHGTPQFARAIHERVRLAREEQDNEQWHLLILQEYIERRGMRGGWLRYRALPQVLAFFYYHLSWLLYVLSPARSYAMNRDFEAHAEREYMRFVADHPELAQEPFDSAFRRDYGEYDNMADVLRSIGLDEREHKLISEGLIKHARFSASDSSSLSEHLPDEQRP